MSVYSQPTDPAKKRSSMLTDGVDRAPARAMLKAVGFTDEDLAKPLVGVATNWIEMMPFRETRNYVSVILRNADAYRRIYSKDTIVKENFAAEAPASQLSYKNGNDQPTKSSRPTGAR